MSFKYFYLKSHLRQAGGVRGHAHQSADHRGVHEDRSGPGVRPAMLHSWTAEEEIPAGRNTCVDTCGAEPATDAHVNHKNAK